MLETSCEIAVPVGDRELHGSWNLPEMARGIVVFVHGSGSSRFSPRNQQVAQTLQEASFATLLMDLLHTEEAEDRTKVFDIDLLSERVLAAIDWLTEQETTRSLPIGLFGASTGAAAALRAAARRPASVDAVVSRGGRPDLAWADLPLVTTPTLLIVGERDTEVLQLNRSALRRLGGPHVLEFVPNATHLFPEPGALSQVADLAKRWFMQYLALGEPSEDPPVREFVNRLDAAQRLAARLKRRSFTNPLVLAIPRGGVVLGAVLANALHADLDVVLSRKLRMPGNPECALGAIAETGGVYLNSSVKEIPPSVQSYLDQEGQHQLTEIARRRDLFRQGRPPVDVTGRSVIVTDDGIATGSTMIAALQALQLQHPREVIVAVPVASPDRLKQVRTACDEIACLIEAPDLRAVGQYYQDFTQVEDEEVVTLLQEFAPANTIQS